MRVSGCISAAVKNWFARSEPAQIPDGASSAQNPGGEFRPARSSVNKTCVTPFGRSTTQSDKVDPRSTCRAVERMWLV